MREDSPDVKQGGTFSVHAAARILVNLAGLLAILLVAGGFAWMEREREEHAGTAQRTVDEIRRFGQMVDLRAATRDVSLNDRGWPTTIDPAWFKGEPPVNYLLSLDRPWVDMATEEEATFLDPLVRVATNKDHASFWYNPSLGVLRARVPMGINDEETLRVYNEVNTRSLASLYGASESGVRTADGGGVVEGRGRKPNKGAILKVSESGEGDGEHTGLAGINPMALPGVPLGSDTSGKKRPEPKKPTGAAKERQVRPKASITPSDRR